MISVWDSIADPDRIKYCDACRLSFPDKLCTGCEYETPELDSHNYDCFDLWTAVQTQWRTSGLGIIGLDYNVLFKMAKILEIDLSPCVMKKIQALESFTMEKMNDVKSDRQRNQTAIQGT